MCSSHFREQFFEFEVVNVRGNLDTKEKSGEEFHKKPVLLVYCH